MDYKIGQFIRWKDPEGFSQGTGKIELVYDDGDFLVGGIIVSPDWILQTLDEEDPKLRSVVRTSSVVISLYGAVTDSGGDAFKVPSYLKMTVEQFIDEVAGPNGIFFCTDKGEKT